MSIEPRDVYVLGAGASKEHGAPLTDDVLGEAFAQFRGDTELDIVEEFLRHVFHCDVAAVDGDRSRLPALVDVLSVVDMAIDRNDHLSRQFDPSRLRQVRTGLEYAIFRALEAALHRSDSSSLATRNLVSALTPAGSTVLSTNYDVIIDRALAMRSDAENDGIIEGFFPEPDSLAIDYGVEFANVAPAHAERFQLLKLHGSFNWLSSGVTGELYFGGMTKTLEQLYGSHDAVYVPDLRSPNTDWVSLTRHELRAVMITPTHLKDLRDPHIAGVWRKAEAAVRMAERLTFVGYSLPGDDIHVKYMLKRALETSQLGSAPKIVVVDPNPDVVMNYERFFGRVDDYAASFSDYAAALSHPIE